MADLTLTGAPGIAVRLRRSAQARRLSLRVSRLDGRVTLTLPAGVGERAGLQFAEERADWIREALAAQAETVPVRIGAAIPIAGVRHVVTGGGRARARIEDGKIVASERGTGAAVAALVKCLARDRLAAACDGFAASIGRPVTTLALRDTRSRWGSCSSAGRLMFSWRLAMAPPEVLDYVAAHEVAHLMRMDHSAAFWETVARLMPGFERPRRWLRSEGATLHRYRFEADA